MGLDWTPNTNHTGFFVAKEMGYYQEVGIEIDIQHPGMDNYEQTPAKKLERGLVDFAIAPSETVISYNTKSTPVSVKAVAAILKSDASAVVTLYESGIERPLQLDGKVYGSYQARYEDKIVEQMIRNDGGKGTLKIDYPEKLGIWNILLSQKCDATWIFVPWEGIEAQGKNIQMNYFRMEEFGIPYGYSPVIIARTQDIEEREHVFKQFMHATRKGFQFASKEVGEAAQILKKYVTDHDRQNINLALSQELINNHMEDPAEWGQMKGPKWSAFISWLKRFDLVDPHVDSEELYTNKLLE